jgi:hypothetical protein
VAKRAVVVDFGEAEVFERQVTDAFEGIVDVSGTGSDIFEEGAELVFTHDLGLIFFTIAVDKGKMKVPAACS